MASVSTTQESAVASGLLKQFGLFEGLAPADLARLADAARFVSMSRGEVVIDYGDRIRDLYCVLGGMVKLLMRTGRRNERVYELLGPGQMFGDALMFLDQPSPGRAVAVEEGRLLVVPGGLLVGMLDGSPGLALRWLRRTAQRVGGLLAELRADAGQSAAQRILRWLVAQVGARTGETRIRLDVSKMTIAASLNTSPETFSRVLKHLRQEGVVRVEGREIVVPDPVRLRYLQPCVFCGKSGLAPESEAAPGVLDWRSFVQSGADCDVPHWFGCRNCEGEFTQWCDVPSGPG